ncbi:hypothetical protein BOW50_11120, partial [Solemya velum gill symbiont]
DTLVVDLPASLSQESGDTTVTITAILPCQCNAEIGIRAPSELVVTQAYQCFSRTLPHVEYLIGYEGDAFAVTDDIQEDLLSITAVHPIRESAIKEMLIRAKGDWSMIDELIDDGKIKEVDYLGQRYYVRRFAEK